MGEEGKEINYPKCPTELIKPVFEDCAYYRTWLEDDFATGWDFLIGTTCVEQQFHDKKGCGCRCHPPFVTNQRDRGEGGHIFEVGTCPKCHAAGTIGYQCQGCHQDIFKRHYFFFGGQEYIMDPLAWAEHEDKRTYLIAPPCNMYLANRMIHTECTKEDLDAWKRRIGGTPEEEEPGEAEMTGNVLLDEAQRVANELMRQLQITEERERRMNSSE